jgi:glycosyltransferase involved in cell wall biosynthesis
LDQIPTVAIVIPCRNEEQYISACLDSILASDYPKEKLEVWVCDGMSDDKTPAIVQEYADKWESVRYLENPEKFTPQALNLGLKASQASIKMILGAHSELDDQYVRKSAEILMSHPEVGCVGGIIDNKYENDTSELIGKAMSSPFGVGNAHFRTGTSSGYVDTVAFGAYRAEVFEQIGFFDEDLVRNQDDEFNFRLTKAGWKIWLDPTIRATYYVRSSIGRVVKQFYQYGYWKVYVNQKHKSVTSLRQLAPPLFTLWLVASLVLAFLWPFSRIGLILGLVMYFFVGLYFAIRKDGRMTQSVNMLGVFFMLHLSYGSGYLIGMIQFMLLRKKPSKRSTKLTR